MKIRYGGDTGVNARRKKLSPNRRHRRQLPFFDRDQSRACAIPYYPANDETPVQIQLVRRNQIVALWVPNWTCGSSSSQEIFSSTRHRHMQGMSPRIELSISNSRENARQGEVIIAQSHGIFPGLPQSDTA